jgi:tetraacyldisaccharide 4'-kinase
MPRPLRFINAGLAPIAALYRVATRLRNHAYDSGWLESHSVGCPVISVGNLTAGGTGKTPVVAFLVGECLKLGLKPGIISRGYRSRIDASSGGVAEVTTSSSDSASAFGDEPSWLARQFPQVPVFVGRDKIASAKSMLAHHRVELIIADDAFQHRRLRRDYDIVLLDASEPSWHYLPLPMGRMRDGFAELKRAKSVFITKTNLAATSQLPELRRIVSLFGATRVFEFESRVSGFSKIESQGSRLAQESLIPKNGKVLLFSGIARPSTFPKLLNGYDVIDHMIFPDHHEYTAEDLQKIASRAGSLGVDFVITTEKDGIKFKSWQPEIDVWVAILEIQLSQESVAKIGDLREDLRGLRI